MLGTTNSQVAPREKLETPTLEITDIIATANSEVEDVYYNFSVDGVLKQTSTSNIYDLGDIDEVGIYIVGCYISKQGFTRSNIVEVEYTPPQLDDPILSISGTSIIATSSVGNVTYNFFVDDELKQSSTNNVLDLSYITDEDTHIVECYINKRGYISSDLISIEYKYEPGRFVWVRDDSSYYSTNGVTWHAMSGIDASFIPQQIAYGDGVFVCVGKGGGHYAYRCTDGETWVPTTLSCSPGNYIGITYGNGMFVVACQQDKSYYSEDGGATWTKSTSTVSPRQNIKYGNNRFIGVGMYGGGAISTDGKTWTNLNTGLGDYDSQWLFYEENYDNHFHCFQDQTESTSMAAYTTLQTNDGYTKWTTGGFRAGSSYCDFSGIAYGNDKLLCMRYGRTSTSSSDYSRAYVYQYDPDEAVWNQISIVVDSAYYSYTNLIFGSDKFVIIGGYSGPSTSDRYCVPHYSIDGITWTQVSGSFTSSTDRGCIAYGKIGV